MAAPLPYLVSPHTLWGIHYLALHQGNNSRIYRAQNWYKSSNALKSKKGRHLKSARQGITKVGGYASLNKWVFSWLLKPSIVCWDLTVCGSLFHSAGAATAKPRLPMCFLGRVEETDRLLPQVRLLDLIKDFSRTGQQVVPDKMVTL